MIPGNFNFIFFLFVLNFFTISFSQDKISSVPLIDLENLKPSFEKEINENKDNSINEKNKIKKKEAKQVEIKETRINIVALDKITAKTSEIYILPGETIKFGTLEIKALQCGNVKSLTEPGHAAYIQVKDLSENKNNQVFVFNGWTFSNSTTLRPLDHPIYDFWLISCDNV